MGFAADGARYGRWEPEQACAGAGEQAGGGIGRPLGDFGQGAGAGQYRAGGQGEHIGQRGARASASRIRQVVQVVQQARPIGSRHGVGAELEQGGRKERGEAAGTVFRW